MKLEIRECNRWADLPDVWKEVKKVKPIEFKNDIRDKNLLRIVKAFFSKDALRPAMTGALVEKGSITVTDAHKVINIPFQSKDGEGVFNINPKSPTGVKLYDKIDERFPEYRNILKKSSKVFKFNAYKLKTYIQAVINGRYPNEYTNGIVFKIDANQVVSFNGEFLTDLLDSMLLLGYDELYFGVADNQYYISPNEKTAKNAADSIGDYPFTLIMPLFIEKENAILGARDIDFETSINVYYAFDTDEIYNADGTVADFNFNLTDGELRYMNSEYLKLMTKITSNKRIPILDNVKVQNSNATVTNLDTFLEVKGVYVQDGIFEIVNGALKNADKAYDVDDFPIMDLDNFDLLIEIPTNQLRERISEASGFVSDDELRPNIMCYSFQFNEKDAADTMRIYATNMYVLYRGFVSGKRGKVEGKEFNVTDTKTVASFMKMATSETVKVYVRKSGGYIMFEAGDLRLIVKLVDNKAPNFEQVLDTNIDTYLEYDTTKLLSVISSIKGEDAKKQIYFDFEGNKFDGKAFNLKLGKGGYGSDFEVEKDLNISVDYTMKPIEGKANLKSLSIIMPINTYNENFAFDMKYLKTVLSISGNKMYFDKGKPSPMFMMEVGDIVSVPEPEKEKEKPMGKPSKAEVMATINALKFLAEKGNEEAKATIQSLKFLI